MAISNIDKLLNLKKKSPLEQFQERAGIPVGYKKPSPSSGGSSSRGGSSSHGGSSSSSSSSQNLPQSTNTTPTPTAQREAQIKSFQVQQQRAIAQQRAIQEQIIRQELFSREVNKMNAVQQKAIEEKIRNMDFNQRQQFMQNEINKRQAFQDIVEQTMARRQSGLIQPTATPSKEFFDKIENSNLFKKYKNTRGGQFLRGTIIDIPSAIVDQTINTSNFLARSTKNPNLIIKPTKELYNKSIEITKKNLNKARNISDLREKSKEEFLKYLKKGANLPKNTGKFVGDVVSAMKKEKTFSDKGVKNIATTFTYSMLDNVTQAPSSIAQLIRNPKQLTQIPKALMRSGGETIGLLKTSPSTAIGRIGADYFSLKLTKKGLKVTGKISNKAYNKLNPLISKFEKNKLKINVPKETFIRGKKEIYLTERATSSTLKKGRIPFVSPAKPFYKKGQFVKFQKDKGITLQSVKNIPTESLAKQIKLSGQRVTGVSAIADGIVGLIKRKKIIRKPLGVAESKLTRRGKSLLNKFDRGSLNKKELIELDNLIKKAGSKGILERSFFADPRGRVRLSRLGIGETKEGSLFDLLSGKATLKGKKPQILVFENTLIDKLPSSLRNIKNKLSKNKPLNKKESSDLLNWQQQKTGKFKPTGFLTRESEITIAPNEIVKRVKKLTTVEINGKRVPVISTKIVKPKEQTSNLIKKYQSGNISKRELNKLNKRLKKETGFDYDNYSYLTKGKKYYPIKRKFLSSIISNASRYKPNRISRGKYSINYKPTKTGSSYTPKPYKPYKPTKTGSSYTPKPYKPYKPTKTGSSYKPKPYKPYKPTKTGSSYSINPKLFSRENKKLIKTSKLQPVFNVYGKSGKKFVKLNNKPLTRDDALSKGAFAIDNTTSKQFKIKPAGKTKKAGILRKGEQNYFNRTGYKFREYKVSRGRAFKINPRYIERTKYGIDTIGEKKGLSIARYIRDSKKPLTPMRKSRKISVSQRKVLLEKFKKARDVRMRNVKRDVRRK